MQFGRAPENAGALILHPLQVKEQERRLGRIDQKVDVAILVCLVARDGAMEVQPANPKSGQALAVFTQTSQGFIATHRNSLTKN
jgi:hypothetical protein